jgi:hypothetical protein
MRHRINAFSFCSEIGRHLVHFAMPQIDSLVEERVSEGTSATNFNKTAWTKEVLRRTQYWLGRRREMRPVVPVGVTLSERSIMPRTADSVAISIVSCAFLGIDVITRIICCNYVSAVPQERWHASLHHTIILLRINCCLLSTLERSSSQLDL